MYVQVRMMDTGVSVTIPTSRTMVVKEFKKLVEEKCNVSPDKQRLFFAGKQLEDQYRLFDYNININDVIQLMIKVVVPEINKSNKPNSKDTIKAKKEKTNTDVSTTSSAIDQDTAVEEDASTESKYFKIGDYVDIKDYHYGSWFIAKVIKIKKDPAPSHQNNNPKSPVENDGLIYVTEIDGCPEEPPTEVQLQEVRPHAYKILPFTELKPGEHVLMNYNAEYPKERGYWYDVLVKEVKTTRKGRAVVGDVSVGADNAVLNNCQLMFLDDIFQLEPYKLLSERTAEDDEIMQTKPTTERAGALFCIKCKDDDDKNCKDCGCRVCGGKDNDDKQLMCDECNHPYHMTCLDPPLTELPEDDDWYCPSCKNDENEIVKAGGKLKKSKKNTPAMTSTSTRDWGKGMACVGRTKKCNIVPSNHFGPIPGVEVGTSWLFRVQVSEAGIHRPPVGGIHGRDNQGAFSIVLSGGYEDDVDNGDEFLYTGSGGRDLSGNKRTALQSCDQQLTRYNRALALNCNAKIDEKGATAADWKNGKPVRVVRNYKLSKHSKYAPETGNRYDGLYKVVKYYPECGLSGFKVWRFVLRRDDPAPAPWTEEGKKRMAQLGLKTIIPENYIPVAVNEPKNKLPGSKRKRALKEAEIVENEQCKSGSVSAQESGDDQECPGKKLKIQYELEEEATALISADTANKKYWDDCKEMLEKGKKAFLDRVEETFLCICCQEIVFEPITTDCSHNICKDCLKRSFSAQVYQCPSCRAELGKNYPMDVNSNLADTLLYLFPGYNADR
ncbi:E3 ubiquitin-protein ligase UHRF1-like [Adelges cooleyi]|uniref:E3 ubiquitin-protein ligase UHRF1-like n=1 Tax=Adelges cooleyi TaxID=133065 RepID=UPI00217F8375|nr:E3 ubiquitin-protein ligase UHRF1-like [Adelges cooleyi]XP_050425725.1 E3 ubiquitin-protein ligase UHRF1-like [Adelges cooleyi]